MTSGILFVDKPEGPTSHTVVAQARRALGLKKIGHAGTLDPMATGLMTLGVGPSTRLLTFLVGLDKTYSATISLGQATVTDDAWGDGLGEAATTAQLDALTEHDIQQTLHGFVGDIHQRPSAVSAIKVDGQRAYDLVRKGKAVDLPGRPVTIQRISIGPIRRTDTAWEVECSVGCSSGTYIRAIARDLGEKLGVGGHLTALRRTMVGPWNVDRAVPPDGITPDCVLDPATIMTEVLPSVTVDDPSARALFHGRRIRLEATPEVVDDDPVAVLSTDNELVAIVSGVSGPVRILVGFSAGKELP